MGRGLSELQRYILAEAGKRPLVYYTDVLLGYFGWKPDRAVIRYGQHRSYPAADKHPEGALVQPGGHVFSRGQIGEAEYRKAMATLSRACLRLEQRGLVTRLQGVYSHWSGVELTDKGKERLSVNSSANFPLS